MSDDIAIRVDHLSKLYRIGLKEQMHETMAGALWSWVKSPVDNYKRLRSLSHFGDVTKQNTAEAQSAQRPHGQDSASPRTLRLGGESTSPSDIIWALRDISFEVKRGEVLGVIGRNGAGKSTLLKILSQITEPTYGHAEIHGRVASLLEVGTGFHPDLTGRENVYLNGTILGMRKKEIDAKFDEIVDFSGIEKFIDTPVKRYSSGMYVRLAFAVAAHLDPEVLLIDEVLAVGDADFQRRCIGKMGEVASQGRTVLFVTHNMGAARSICRTAILINDGALAHVGTVYDVVDHYLHSIQERGGSNFYDSTSDKTVSNLRAHILDCRISSPGSSTSGHLLSGAQLEFRVRCRTSTALKNPVLGIGIDTDHGQRVVTFISYLQKGMCSIQLPAGTSTLVCRPQQLALAPGTYRVKLSFDSGNGPAHVVNDAFIFVIAESDFYNAHGRIGQGVILCQQEWTVTTE